MSESRVLAVLFADIVDSTRLLVELGDRFVELGGRLADRLAAQTAECGGVVTKELGDGLMATFPSAGAAIDAAIELQQQTWELAREAEVALELTVGVSIGDLTPRGDGDWIGLPAVEAARLCAAASPGHILVSDTALLLARRTDAVTSIGALELKGLDQPLPTSEVHWTPPDATSAVAIPRALDAALDGPFVGRSEPLDALLDMWKSARVGHGGVALLAGEPGVGKTRLTAELGRHAHDGGGLVVYGHCDDDKGIAFQPFVEAARFVLASTEVDAPAGLARILPELALRQPPAPLDPELARLELLDAVRRLLTDAAHQRPLLLVLEDLHWANDSTLAVVRHLLDGIDDEPVLVVMTYRSTDVDRTHPLGALLADLRRGTRTVRIAVDGFSVDEVEELLEASAGHGLDDTARDFAATLRAETGGNAFFLREVLTHLVESGELRQDAGRWSAADPGQLSLPEGVRDVVGRRLSALSDETNAVLASAAVIGRTFDVRVLEAITGFDVLDALDEAGTAGLVRDSGRAATFQFAHALVRETLLAELSSVRRARVHEQVMSALESLPHDQDRLPEIARHAIAAAPTIDPDRLARCVHEAGGHLFANGAYDDALELGHQAVAVLDDIGFQDSADVARLLSAYAGTVWWNGSRDPASPIARRAVDVARASGDDEAFVQAVASFGRIVPFGLDPDLLVLLPEALARAEPDSAALVELRGMQILAGFFASMGEDLVQAGREVLEMAARNGDAEVAATARFLAAFGAVAGVDAAYARERAEASIADRAEAQNFPATIYVPAAWSALRLGDLVRAEADVTAMFDDRVTPMLVGFSHQLRSITAALRLDLDTASAETQRLRELLPDDAMFLAGCELQDIWSTYLRSGPAAALERGADTIDLLPYPRFTAGLRGFLVAQAGDLDAARELFEQAYGDGIDDLPRDWTYQGTLHELAELAADLGATDEARAIDAALEPYGDQLVLAICTHVPASVPFTRGRLAVAMGERERGLDLLRHALVVEERAGAEALTRRTRAELAALDTGT
jgi:class 3 adenylate cyclase/tetratricopeptide (TPR) repeat protein